MNREYLIIYSILLIKSAAVGVLTVLTPFIYAVFPITTGILSPRSKPKSEGRRNSLIYALSLMSIFTSLGILVAIVVQVSGITRFTAHWIFNFALFRLFVGLGLVFIGAFDIKFPASWSDPTATKAQSGSVAGIFYMALTLPIVSFSSMAPMLVLVLLFTGNSGFYGPIISMFGFAAGLSLPMVYPKLLQIFVSNKGVLNQIKVILGFSSIIIGMKFYSYADIALGWNLLDKYTFIILLIMLSLIVGLYLLGIINFPKDYAPKQNRHSIAYVSLPALCIAIGLITFIIYLLPGLFGAPLTGISWLLPDF